MCIEYSETKKSYVTYVLDTINHLSMSTRKFGLNRTRRCRSQCYSCGACAILHIYTKLDARKM